MPWPPEPPEREDVPEDELEFYDQVVARMGATRAADIGYYGRLLRSPALTAQLSGMGRLVRMLGERGDSYSHAEREFVDQVLCADFKTNAVLKLHIPDALATGVRLEAIDALRNGDEAALTDEERELAAFIRAVVNGRVTKAAWESLEARMGPRGVLEYAMFILFLQLTIRMYQAVGMPDPPDAEIDALLQEFRDGTRELPDFKQRIR